MILKTRADIFPYYTDIRTEHLYSASELLTSLITFGPQPNKAIVGANAFAHEAGIHQHGVMAERTTYEIMDPSDIGLAESRLVAAMPVRARLEHPSMRAMLVHHSAMQPRAPVQEMAATAEPTATVSPSPSRLTQKTRIPRVFLFVRRLPGSPGDHLYWILYPCLKIP